MISAASAQIEAIGGDSMKITIIKNGKPEVVPDYAKVQGILLGAIAAFVIFITVIGPECVFVPISSFRTWEHLFVPFFSHRNHGSHFEQEKPGFEDGGDKMRSVEDEERTPDILSEDISEKS
jgi:SHS family lactate transporter-like MFS transporter